MALRVIRSRSKGFTCLRIRSTWTEAPPLTSTEKNPAASRYGRHPHRGHGHEPVFEVGLGDIPLVVAQVVALGLPQHLENLGGAHSPDNSSLHGSFPC